MKILRQVLGALTLVAAVAGVHAAPLTSGTGKDVLYVSQSALPNGNSNIVAKTGPLSNSSSGFGIEVAKTTLAQNAVPVALPYIDLGTGHATATGLPTKGIALTRANRKVQDNISHMRNGLVSFLKQYGLSASWFNFKQRVFLDVAGSSQEWMLYWDYFVDAEGRGNYGDVQLVTPDPRLLYVTYTPAAVDDMLPKGWVYPDAGKLSYQLRTIPTPEQPWQAITEWTTVQTNGAYDSPQSETQEVLDAGLACLMDNAPASCPKAFPSVRGLLDDTGAAFAIVDYRRRVQPVYKTNADGTQSPNMTLSIDKRELRYVGCSDVTYVNEGEFGFELDVNIGRYLALSSGEPRVVNYRLLNEFYGKQQSPIEKYNYSMKVTRPAAKSINPYAINPLNGVGLYLIKDLPGVIKTAAIDVVGDVTFDLGSFTSESYYYGGGADEFKVRVTGRCTDAGYELKTRLQQSYKGGEWQYHPEQTTMASEAAWTPVSLWGHGSSRFKAWAQEAAGMLHFQDYVKNNSSYWITHDGYPESHNFNALMKDGPGYTGDPGWGGGSAQYFSCGSAAANWYIRTMVIDTADAWHYEYSGPYSNSFCMGTEYFRGFDLNSRSPSYQVQQYPAPYDFMIDPSKNGAQWMMNGEQYRTQCWNDETFNWGNGCVSEKYTPCTGSADACG